MKNKTQIIKYLTAALIIAALVFIFTTFDIKQILIGTLEWIESIGIWGPVIFIGMYILACVFFLPGSILTLGAGAIFGVAWGSVYVSIAATLGATAAFLTGRYFAREMVAKKIEGNQSFKSIDEAVAGSGWKIVSLIRLSPIFPFSLLNYAFGLTKVKLKDYVFGSWLGMIPGAVMYVYLGSLAGDIASIASGSAGQEKTPLQWALYVVGFIATIAVTVYVTKVAKKALGKKVEEKV